MTMLVYRVGNIETGDIYTVRIDVQDFSLIGFKNCLSTFSGIAPNEQILLIGPPFKRLDTQFTANMQDEDQKIYLYNRKLFTDSSIIPKEIKLKPYEMLEPPALIDIPNSVSLETHHSPVLRTLPGYERQYLFHIRRGETYLSCSEQISASCKRCFEQMEVQQQSLLAAIGNLEDHYHSTQLSYDSAWQKLQEQQTKHKSLLDNFESSLERLRKIPIHPNLYPPVTTEEELVAQREKGMTLLDTLPVEKEHAWVHKCTRAHETVEENMKQLQIIYEKVTLSLQTLNYNQIDLDIARGSELLVKLDEDIELQKSLLSDLRESYHSVNEKLAVILDKVSSGEESIAILEEECTELSKELAAGSRKQETEVLASMEDLCVRSMRTKDEMAHVKNALTKEIFRVMKQVAHIQTDIQFKLRKGMDLMKKWRQGDNGYFQHLERIEHLPESYRQFLKEVLRRKQYTEDFEKLINTSVTHIRHFRDVETKKREEFMESLGNSLPPLFFESVPSLIEKPPYFSATVTERQYLPDISIEDISSLTSLGVYSNDDDILHSMNSSLSSITLTDNDILAGLISRERTDSMVSMGDRDVTFPTLENQSEITPFQRIEELESDNKKLKEQLKILSLRLSQKPQAIELTQSSSTSLECQPFEAIINHFVEEANAILSSLNTSSATLSVVEEETKGNDRKISGGDEAPSQQMRDSLAAEAVEAFNKLSQSISKAQLAFDSKMKDLQSRSLPVTTVLPQPPLTDLAALPPSEPLPKISFLSFEVGDIALFLSTNKPDVYLAFSHGKCPHRYLSQDSLTQFKSPKQTTPTGYILGKIIFIESKIASKTDKYPGIGPINNPLRLADGVEYHLVDIEKVSFGSKHSRRKSGTMKSKESENEKESSVTSDI